MPSTIVDWGHYSTLYNTINQATFDRLEPLAESRVRAAIGTHRWNSINPNAFYYNQLKDCICTVIDRLALCEKSGAGAGLASVSNDGYSESYAVRTAEEYENEIRTCIIYGLSGTGLISAFPLGG